MKTSLILFPLLAFSPIVLANRFDQDRDIVNNWKQYYKGEPSFKFETDPNFAILEKSVNETKKRMDEAQDNIKPFRKIIADESKAIEDRKKENSDLDKESNEKLKEKFKLGTQILSVKKQIDLTSDANKKAELQAQLDSLMAKNNEIEARINEIQAKKIANEDANKQSEAKISQVKTETQKLEEIAAKLTEAHKKSIERRDEYKTKLVKQILAANNQGSDVGNDHAISDATDLASELGSLYGTRDGSTDGEQDGKREGIERVRVQASAEGEAIGAKEAREQGLIDGSREGRIAGNQNRGSEDGTKLGLAQAQSSDAKVRGQELGSSEGLSMAKTDGQRDGSSQGSSQAISKYESVKLQDIIINGSFSGAFGKNPPSFPNGRDRGSRYNDRGSYKDAILKEAFKDGYDFSYNRNYRRHFNEVINDVYSEYYSRQYSIIFTSFAQRDYPEVRSQSFDSSKRNAFNRDYPTHKNQARTQTERDTFNNPDTNSQDYRISFDNSKTNAFNSEYSRIKEDARVVTRKATYDANYPQIKEQSRQSSFASVESVYTNSSVIKVNAITVREVGIKSVGSEDGIFQPNEVKVYDIVVTNFGKKEKTDAKVFINGKGYNLGEIPGQTIARIQAVAKGEVLGRLGSIDNDQIVVSASANNEIEARHFVSPKDQIVKSENITNGKVQYPLSVERLGLSGELLRGEQVGLRLDLSNISKKMLDEVKVTIKTDDSSIIKKEFSILRNISKDKSATDAVISVTNIEDTYKPTNISVILEKDGVVVGELSNSLTVVAKEKLDTSKEVIIVADASDSLRQMQDLIAENGGLSKVGVLDTTVRTANNDALTKGLKNKVLLVNTNGSVTGNIEAMVRNSENIAIVTTNASGLNDFKRHDSLFKDSTVKEFFFAGNGDKTKVLMANARRNKNVKTNLNVLAADEREYKGELEVAKTLAKSNDQIVSDVNASVNGSNYFNGDFKTNKKAEAVAVRAFDEIFQINDIYDDSITVFGDKDIADLVADDKNLLHNKLNQALGSKATSANLGSYLVSHNLFHSLKEGLESHKPFEKDMRSAVTKRLFTFKKLFKKIVGPLSEIENKFGNVKSLDKNVYSNMTSKNGHHKPYRLEK